MKRVQKDIFSRVDEAIESGDCPDLRYCVEKLNKLAEERAHRTIAVRKLVLIADKFAQKGLPEEAVATCEIAVQQAPIHSPEENKAATDMLGYLPKLPPQKQLEVARKMATELVDIDTPLGEKVCALIGRIDIDAMLRRSGRAATRPHNRL